MSSAPSSSAKPIDRVNLACVQCRARHVKCDATTPTCNRCRRDGKDCEYAKSRRGGLDKAALARRRLALQKQQQQSSAAPFQTPSSTTSSSSGERSEPLEDPHVAPLGMLESISIDSTELTFAVSSDRLVQLYFEYFHPGHPFLLPHSFFVQRLQSGAQDMKALETVMQYIGSRYAPWATPELYRTKAEAMLAATKHERTPFRVQTLLLHSIAQHYCSQWTEDSETLAVSIQLALDLGMAFREFASQYGEGTPALEESWRRTFWTLYVTDQHYAVVKRSLGFHLDLDPRVVTVDLPCEESEYESGVIPRPRTFAEFDMRELDEVETVYSSFTYLLDAIRIISGLIRNYADLVTPWDDMIAATDARIAAWTSLLPTCKKEPIHPDGTVDEVMYFAHLAILILIVQLHRPQSSVTYSKEEWQTGFIPCPPMNMIPTKHERRNVHTAKILRALEKQTQLLTLPSPLILHAPFTVCIVAGCATAHVATCALFPDDRRLEVGRDRLRLSIGAVRACADIWPLNRQMLADAQMVAKGTLSPSTSLPRQPAREPLAPMNFQYTSSPEALDDFSFTIGPMSDVDIFSTLELSSMHQDWSALLDPSSLSTL